MKETVVRARLADPIVSIRRDMVGLALLLFAFYLIGLSLLMLVAPGTFFSEVGPFGVRNDHYVRDAGTFQLALGVLALVAAKWRSWRLPALFALTFQFTLHTINHLIDIGEADPSWLGMVDFVGLAAATVVLALLLWHARSGSEVSLP